MVDLTIELYKDKQLISAFPPFLWIAPVEVQFKSVIITGTPIEYHWDFGDGQTSTYKNPVHTYTTYGYHTVILTVIDLSGEWTFRLSEAIILSKLDFESDVVSGRKPLEVQFNNLSISPTGYQLVDWVWSFEGITAAQGVTGPLHTFADDGSYNIIMGARITGINP